MHLGEGIDERASQEIRKVARSNLFGKKIVAVHGVVMSCTHAASFKALVWCPASNFLLFGKTAAVDQLKNSIHIVFGTDSTLTSPWRVKEHFQMALQGGLVTEEELVAMLTLTAAQTWKFHNKGQIAENKNADIVAYSSGSLDSARLQLVIKNGEVMVAEETILNSNNKFLAERYSRIRLDGQVLIVKGNLDEIVHSISRFYPEADIPFELL